MATIDGTDSAEQREPADEQNQPVDEQNETADENSQPTENGSKHNIISKLKAKKMRNYMAKLRLNRAKQLKRETAQMEPMESIEPSEPWTRNRLRPIRGASTRRKSDTDEATHYISVKEENISDSEDASYMTDETALEYVMTDPCSIKMENGDEFSVKTDELSECLPVKVKNELNLVEPTAMFEDENRRKKSKARYANETPEQKARRLERQRLYRLRETESQRTARLARKKIRVTEQLKNETPEQRSIRLERQRRYRQRMTETQRAAQRERAKIWSAKRYANETPEQRARRLERQRLRNKTEAERAARLARQNRARLKRIATETDEGKPIRVERQRKRLVRLTEEERLEQRMAHVERQRTARLRRLAAESDEEKLRRIERRKLASKLYYQKKKRQKAEQSIKEERQATAAVTAEVFSFLSSSASGTLNEDHEICVKEENVSDCEPASYVTDETISISDELAKMAEEEREEKLDRLRTNRLIYLAQETEEQARMRRARQNMVYAKRRATQTDEQRTARLERARVARLRRLAAESEKEKLERIAWERTAKRLRYQEKKRQRAAQGSKETETGQIDLASVKFEL